MATNDEEPGQIQLMRRMVEMSAKRTELAAERTYMAAERTLSVWVRTALALMAFGVAIDRLAVFLHHSSADTLTDTSNPDVLAEWGAAALIALGVLMAVTTGLRYLFYVLDYQRKHRRPERHGPFLAPAFSFLVALFGIALLVVQLLI